MVTIKIKGKPVGEKHPVMVVAEAGLNHNGNIKKAKKLIFEAKKCGVDAIKFQTYKTENFLSAKSLYYKFFKNVELSFEEFKELNHYAKNVGITFFSTPFDIESAIFLNKIKVPCFKIASSDLTNFPLVVLIARMKKPIIISTGLATMNEVKETVNLCIRNGNKKIILLHSVSNYPTVPEEANLLAITSMKEKFRFPVGFSDNGESTLVDLIAVSLGANLIEKHFTLNKKLKGPDHSFSIEPQNLKNLILQVRLIEKIKGDGSKRPQKSELKLLSDIRKSIFAASDLKKDQKISYENLSIKRPEIGIRPKYITKVLNRNLKKDIKKDMPIKLGDIY